MSSQGARGSFQCCTNRDPPSLDGGPPRPTASSSKASRTTDRDRLSSYSTEEAEAAILRSIFDENKAKGLEMNPFKRSSVYKLSALFVGDKSDVSDEELQQDIEEKRSSSTLNSITQKLKKHLSLEITLAKKRSRSSVGTAEEVGRRAELRRIRNQRIQEELSNETTYDDDAKSLSPISDAEAFPEKDTQASIRAWEPSDTIPLPPLLTHDLVDPASISDKLSSSNRPKGHLVGVEGVVEEGSRTPVLLSSSSPAESTSEETQHNSQTQFNQHTRELSSIPTISPAPILQPKRLPSITEPLKSSWRLSFASSNRGEVLRNLSLVNGSTDAVDTEQWSTSPQALRTLLHNQRVRSSSSALVSLDEAHSRSLACRSQPCTGGQGSGGVGDKVGNGPSIVGLHEMRISQRLGSSGVRTSCSSTRMPGCDPRRRRNSSNSDGSQIEGPDDLWNTSDCVSLTEEIAELWDQVMQEGHIPLDSPTSNKTKNDMETPYLNIVFPPHEIRSKNGTHEFEKIDSMGVSTALSTPAAPTNQHPSSQHSSVSPLRRSTVSNSSVLASETESFRGREAELNIIGSRLFRKSQNSPNTPVSTKFKEEFHLNLQPPKSWMAHTPSVLVRLSKLISRYYDGRASTGEPVAIPIVPIDLVKSTTGGSEPGRGGRGAWVFKSRYNPRSNARKRTEDGAESSRKFVLGGLSNMAWPKLRKAGKTDLNESNDIVRDSEERLEECSSIEELEIDTWAQQVPATEIAHKADKEKVVKRRKTNGPDLRFPATWASYPSRSHRARNRSAGRPDSIHVRDFAIETSDNEELSCNRLTEHVASVSGPSLDGDAKMTTMDGLMGNLEQGLKPELIRLKTTVDPSGIDDIFDGGANPSRLDYRQLPRLERLLMDALPIKGTTAAHIARSILLELAEQAKDGNSSVKPEKKDLMLREAGIEVVNESPTSWHSERPLQQLNINIGDPKFYEDCIVSSNTGKIKQKSSEQENFMRGNGSNTEKHKYGSSCSRENISLGTAALRKSTDEYHSNLELMEKVERERVLQAVEEAWG